MTPNDLIEWSFAVCFVGLSLSMLACCVSLLWLLFSSE